MNPNSKKVAAVIVLIGIAIGIYGLINNPPIVAIAGAFFFVGKLIESNDWFD